MEPERWQEIERLCYAALNEEKSARAAFLERACGGDEALRRAVELLLAQHEKDDDFLEVPAMEVAAKVLAREQKDDTSGLDSIPPTADTAANLTSAEGISFGPYRLLQKLGEGGMGEVWLAEQTRPVRRLVALKLIKAGMDTREVVARFESERQALALMDHPAIAKVFDAGSTPEGRPYFVMEYVAGVPITAYCDKHRMTTRQRMELFIQVCEGVQHAHQKAIIHRDLKPSNILVSEVDGKPMPRIIDFGLAKATSQRLTDGSMYTRVGTLLGTLEYMSPEQADSEGKDIDTRTDVYSLGVVLYQLLVGALPLDLKKLAYEEILRLLRDKDIPKPSSRILTQGGDSAITAKNRGTDAPSLTRQLRGDPDAVVLKALEKDRNRRYGSPSELAADLGRYLRNEPVSAHTPSAAYRTRKYIRRHRLGVAMAVAAGASVVVLSSAAILWNASRPLPEPRIGDTVRITNDPRSVIKHVAGTDGSRIFLALYETPFKVGQMPITGGDFTALPIKRNVGTLSPDGKSFIAFGDHSEIWIVGISGSPARLLTRGESPAWSADGKQIIYVDSKGEIYTIPSAGGEPHLIRAVGGPDFPFDFVYSPDGGKIRFLWGRHRLMEMSPGGSDLHEILAGWHPTDLKCCGLWTPDGNFFLFFSATSSDVAGYPAHQMWAVDERRGWMHRPPKEPVQLTFGPTTWLNGATISPDGGKIFANGETWRGELVRYNRQTKQLEPFLDSMSADMLDFSRDGKYVVYASFPGVTLLRANRDGTDVQQVVGLPDHPVTPRWSPDNSQIAFTVNSYDLPNSIYVVSSQGGAPIRVLPDNNCCNESDPTWSPDGKQLALWVESPNGKTENELRIVDVSTHKLSFLPRPPKRTWSPRWSPDGRYIVCLTGPYPATDGLEIYDFKTNKWKIILTEPGSGNWPSWSHDSRWIYYQGTSHPLWSTHNENRLRIYRISPEESRPESVADLPGFRGTGYDWSWIGLDPDDNPLLLRDAGTSEIYSMTLERK